MSPNYNYSNNFCNYPKYLDTITPYHQFISVQFLNLEGCWGSIDAVATFLLHISLSSAALRELPNAKPVHSLILYSHRPFCLPLLLTPFTVLCRVVVDIPEDLEMLQCYLSFHIFTAAGRSSFVIWSM